MQIHSFSGGGTLRNALNARHAQGACQSKFTKLRVDSLLSALWRALNATWVRHARDARACKGIGTLCRLAGFEVNMGRALRGIACSGCVAMDYMTASKETFSLSLRSPSYRTESVRQAVAGCKRGWRNETNEFSRFKYLSA